MVALLSVAFSGALALSGPAGTSPAPSVPTPRELLLLAPDRKVRAPDPRVKALLLEGFQRSPTLAALVGAINRSDVIVYVESVMILPKDTLGRLTMVPVASGVRYLRIQIRADLPKFDAIALIGHELQHALEVANDRRVRDADGMIALYERIGHSTGGDHVYDTTGAQDTGRQVRRELTMSAAQVDYRGNLSGLSVNSASTPSVERK